MSKLPTIKALTREDLKDAPDWIIGLIDPLNSFMRSTYAALDRDITFTENIASALKEISFTTRSDYLTATPLDSGFDIQQIYNPLRVKPTAVHLGKIVDLTGYKVITNPVFIYWEFLDGYIKIKYVTGLAPSNKYQLNLLIF